MPQSVIALPVYNQEVAVLNRLDHLANLLDDETTILVVDDGSNDSLDSELQITDSVHYLKHEKPLGYGGAVMSALEYTAAHKGQYCIFLDITNDGFREALETLEKGIADGNDIVNCSRFEQEDLTEDYASLHPGHIVTAYLRDTTGFPFTDFFSPFRAIRMAAISDCILEEFDEAVLIQLWVQAAHFKLKCTERYCREIMQPGVIREALELDDDYYINFVRGELIQYPV